MLIASRRIAAFCLSLMAVSCGANEAGPPAPIASLTAPTTFAAVPSSELIAGSVYDSAFRPIAGATVEIVQGQGAGVSTTSDARGGFSLAVPGVIDDTMQIRASKSGYITSSAPPQPYCDRCRPNRWVFFYLDVPEPPVQLAGDYSLTFVADKSCSNLPDDLLSRTYQATVTPTSIGYPSYPANSRTSYEMTVKGDVFSDTFHTFFLNVAGNYINISIGDHTDPGVAERVGPNTYYTFNGTAALTVETATVSSISTPFRGWIEHCVLGSPVGGRYDCPAAKAVTVHRCEATHQLILTKVE